ncbi:MAG: hypothetical protein MRZ79_12975 [Bacteroidia bacterium]|nr:hypothetical protein [Bacteroidia bacterium]
MKVNILLLPLLLGICLISCKSGKDSLALEQLKEVNALAAKLADKPQILTTASNKKTSIEGKKGTIIHVDPEALETVDGSPLGKSIDVELLEMTDLSSMALQNAPTVSDGRLLETGGAYYLGMSSDGKQLRIKSGKSIEVEFPKLTDKEMNLFTGEKDPTGKINWKPSSKKFESKDIPMPEKPKAPRRKKVKKTVRGGELGALLKYMSMDSLQHKETMDDEAYKAYLKRKKLYDKRMQEIEKLKRTYQAQALLRLGWVNIDYFAAGFDDAPVGQVDEAPVGEIDEAPFTKLEFEIQNDSLLGARIYAAGLGGNYLLALDYWKGQKQDCVFRSIPTGFMVQLVAISADETASYLFETVIDPQKTRKVEIDFAISNPDEIKKQMAKLDR